jgi:hypothetical protein
MNIALYRRYLNLYVKEALENSDGTKAGIASYLSQKTITGLLVQHKEEKNRALADARQAFNEHRHWPLEIVLSHLGVDLKETEGG